MTTAFGAGLWPSCGWSNIRRMDVDPAKLAIVHYPDPVLRQAAEPVPAVDETVRAVAQRMLELMREAPGVGLAAPQVGLPWRMFVANPTGEPEDDRVFINPTLHDPGTHSAAREEGCLSLPRVFGEITRPTAIAITATDEHGESFTLTSDELPARVWQHEYDHLDGVLILDRMRPIDKMANRRILKELEAEAV